MSGMGLAADWPRWRGPDNTGKSAETGLMKQWPEDGPALIWKATGIGTGFSSTCVAGGSLYTTGSIGDETIVTALGLDGKIRWQAKNGAAWKKSSPGSRSTPTVEGDRLYTINPHGDVVCLKTTDGSQVWGLSLKEKFGGRNITWGLAESLLIDGDNVIVSPGGPAAALAALNKATGETVWVCKGKGDKPSYSSAVIFECGGIRQICQMTAVGVIGVDAKTGALLWSHPHKTSWDANIPDPIYHDGQVFIDSGYGSGGAMLMLAVEGGKVSASVVWKTKALDNHHGGIILHDGYLYGSTHKGKWVCLEWTTGKTMYSADGVGKGSVTFAEGMLYTYSEKGKMGIVKATPDAHEVVSQFRVPKGGGGPHWAHPVVAGGRLYLRHADALFAYDIKAK
jgi:hypothetical protein